MKLNSIRTRVTLWNVAVLALVLGSFALIVRYTAQATLEASLDRDLMHTTHHVTEWWSGMSHDDFTKLMEARKAARGSEQPVSDQLASGRIGHGRAMAAPDRAVSNGTGMHRGVRGRGRNPEEIPGGGARPVAPSSAGAPGPRLARLGPRDSLRRPRIFDAAGHSMFPARFPDDRPLDAAALNEAAQGRQIFSTGTVENEPARIFSAPLMRDGHIYGAVQSAHPLTETIRLLNGLTNTLLALIPVALLFTGLGGAFLTGRALRPVRDITHTAGQIGAEDLSRRLDVQGADEFAELASTFNGMIARLQEAFTRLENAYEQQRRFTGDASHELRTPLTTIKAETSLALCGQRTPAEYRRALEAADGAADVMNRIVQDLLLLARSDSGQLTFEERPTRITDLLQRAVGVLSPGAASPEIRWDMPADPPMVMGDPHHLARLFVNLLENAARHTPHDGTITLTAFAAGLSVIVKVEDTGEGIAPQHLPHVCERFYRVDAARSRTHGGTGLGLAICHSIVQAHHGAMTIESAVGRGTRVTVTLPRAIGADGLSEL